MADGQDLVGLVRTALGGPKGDPYMLHEFNGLLANDPFKDLETTYVSFTARGRAGIEFEGKIGVIDTVYTVRVPYSMIPMVLANEDIYHVEASRDSWIVESSHKHVNV